MMPRLLVAALAVALLSARPCARNKPAPPSKLIPNFSSRKDPWKSFPRPPCTRKCHLLWPRPHPPLPPPPPRPPTAK